VRPRLSKAAIVCALASLGISSALAQKPAPPAPSDQKKSPAKPSINADDSREATVIEQLRASFKFQNDGTGQAILYARVRIQSPQSVQAWGQLIFTYDSASDRPHVDFVRVHKPDGRVVTAGPDAVQDLSSPVQRVAPMYSDLRQLHEAQLSAATLATVGTAQVALTTSLPNYWETMGWIKFKQNDLKSAKAYISAAWMINDDATIGDHLGQIYENEGRKDDAIHAYALALNCSHPPPETRGRLAALVGDKKVDSEIAAV
jgi:tetratricopeptide (TPR) repeat protein